jgi:hypothetical protein
MWVRRTATGWKLARQLEIAGWIVAAGLAGVSALAIYAAVVVSPIELAYLPLTAAMSAATARIAIMRVDVLEEGIVVVNPLRTTVISWSEFAGFSVGPWRVWRCMALVERRGTRPLPIGVLVISPMYYDTRVEDAVRALSEDMQARRGSD